MHEHFWKENMKYEELKTVDLFHSQYDFVDWKEIAVFIMTNKKNLAINISLSVLYLSDKLVFEL